MSRQHKRLPHQIDPFRLCEARASLSGPVPLKQMQRLKPLLASDSGEINVVLDFDIDELGVPFVKGELQAELSLICQRCLEPFPFVVKQQSTLAWVRSDQEAERLPLRYEPYLVESNPLILNDVIEDELLLALPQIPMHAEAQCPASKWLKQQHAETADETEENPFSVLANLKQD